MKVLASMIVTSTLLLGCATAPVSTLNGTIKTTVALEDMKQAITQASGKASWEVVKDSNQALVLKKVYIERRLHTPRPVTTPKFAQEMMYVHVDFSSNGFTVSLADENGAITSKGDKLHVENMEELKEGIFATLAQKHL